MMQVPGDKSNLIIFGGLSGVPMTNLACFELDVQPDLMKYKMLKPKVITDEEHTSL